MQIRSFIAVTIFILVPNFGSAQEANFPYACAFEKTILFGASISANTMVNGVGLLTGVLTGATNYGVSPGHILVNEISKKQFFRNDSAPLGTPTGGEQAVNLLSSYRADLDNSTAIIGIDAFYWDAAFGDEWAVPVVSQLIEYARQNQKNLILGTIPNEDPSHVKWATNLPQAFTDWLEKQNRYAWKQPQKLYLEQINQVIRTECQIRNGCYISDLATMSDKLNAGQKLTLNDGESFGLYGIRPDGVHLSQAGSEYIVEDLLRQFSKQPPLINKAVCGSGKHYVTPPPQSGS